MANPDFPSGEPLDSNNLSPEINEVLLSRSQKGKGFHRIGFGFGFAFACSVLSVEVGGVDTADPNMSWLSAKTKSLWADPTTPGWMR